MKERKEEIEGVERRRERRGRDRWKGGEARGGERLKEMEVKRGDAER